MPNKTTSQQSSVESDTLYDFVNWLGIFDLYGVRILSERYMRSSLRKARENLYCCGEF